MATSDMAALATLRALARRLGGHAADAFFDEFGQAPIYDGMGLSDWHLAAWEVAKKELADAGMTRETYDDALEAWTDGLFGL